MTEGEKEKIKHKAAFYNGLGLVCMGATSLGAGYRVIQQIYLATDYWSFAVTGIRGLFIFSLGMLIAYIGHMAGQFQLSRLDDDESKGSS
jgi:hypothetical protein